MAKTTKRKAPRKTKTAVKDKTVGKLKRAMKIRVSPDTDAAVLDRLWSVVMGRRDADPAVSHSSDARNSDSRLSSRYVLRRAETIRF